MDIIAASENKIFIITKNDGIIDGELKRELKAYIINPRDEDIENMDINELLDSYEPDDTKMLDIPSFDYVHAKCDEEVYNVAFATPEPALAGGWGFIPMYDGEIETLSATWGAVASRLKELAYDLGEKLSINLDEEPKSESELAALDAEQTRLGGCLDARLKSGKFAPDWNSLTLRWQTEAFCERYGLNPTSKENGLDGAEIIKYLRENKDKEIIIKMAGAFWRNDGFAEGESGQDYRWVEPITFEGGEYRAVYNIPAWYNDELDTAPIDWDNPDYVLNEDGEKVKTDSDGKAFYGNYDEYAKDIIVEKLDGHYFAGYCRFGTNYEYSPELWELLVFTTETARDAYIVGSGYNGNNFTVEAVDIDAAVKILGLNVQGMREYDVDKAVEETLQETGGETAKKEIIKMSEAKFLGNAYAEGEHGEDYKWTEPFQYGDDGRKYEAVYHIPAWYDHDIDDTAPIDWKNPNAVYGEAPDDDSEYPDMVLMASDSNGTGFNGKKDEYIHDKIAAALDGYYCAGYCSYGTNIEYSPNAWDLLAFKTEQGRDAYIKGGGSNGRNHTLEAVDVDGAVKILGLTAARAAEFDVKEILQEPGDKAEKKMGDLGVGGMLAAARAEAKAQNAAVKEPHKRAGPEI
jgi:hypothetical protein